MILRNQLTIWDWATSLVETVHGLVPYKQWCELEAARIGRGAQAVDGSNLNNWTTRGKFCVVVEGMNE